MSDTDHDQAVTRGERTRLNLNRAEAYHGDAAWLGVTVDHTLRAEFLRTRDIMEARRDEEVTYEDVLDSLLEVWWYHERLYDGGSGVNTE